MPPRVRRPRGRNLNYVLEERKARRRTRLRGLLVGTAALAIAIVLFLEWRAARRAPAITPFRIVVLPLENRTGDAAFDTLGLVASDWITRVLGFYRSAHHAVPTTTTLAYLRSAQLGRFDLLTRAQRLARGTRSQILVWGSFYRTGDTLRFNVEVNDLEAAVMLGSVPQVAAPLHDPMSGVDRLRSAVVGAILHTESLHQRIYREVPELHAYQAYVAGLDHFMQRRYGRAAADFARAAVRDSAQTIHDVWLLEALVQTREFARADSVSRSLSGARATRSLEARALRSYARLRGDRGAAYLWTMQLARQNSADDLAHYETALEALATGRAREARTRFGEMHPAYGALHGRPDFYLHYAAAYHLLELHRIELGVVRDGLMRRGRSLDVRLANCRVRAALGNEERALAAMHALAARDTDTASVLTLGEALNDCAGELDAHGLASIAEQARQLARRWYAARPPQHAIVRDSVFERAHAQLDQARAVARQGALGDALELLNEAVLDGLPFYEPGRMMLHAEPAFSKLRNTRGFLRVNRTRG